MMVNSMTREEIQIQQINQDIKIFENRMAELSKSKINVQELRDYYEGMIRELRSKRRYWERRMAINDKRRD